MANIMLNKACNLQCPYCFANEFVNKPNEISNINRASNISIEDFKIALDFIAKSGTDRVGIIGGEPTMHPKFKELMTIVINDKRFESITLFTNGITLKDHIEILKHPKVHGLINTNSPNDMTESKYKNMLDSFEALERENILEKFAFGINMYKLNFDYKYMLDLLIKYKKTHVRTAIVVPNSQEMRDGNPLNYFRKMKPSIFNFFRELEKHEIMPTYDCNQMPTCITTPEEKKWLSRFWKWEGKNGGKRCNLTDNSQCGVVIDILPDLTAVRCFGMSEEMKVNIKDFRSENELRTYFKQTFDTYAFNIPASGECKDCYYRKIGQCMGGCLAFKNKEILKQNKKLEEIYDVSYVIQ